MKIWTSTYKLQPQEEKIKPREGALVKVEWTPGQIGYSDIHPWPEFGEPALPEQLKSLRELQFTPLVEQSMEFNFLDKEFRAHKRNAFLGLILPRSHRLVFDMDVLEEAQLHEWHKQGFSHIKVKLGRNLKHETELLLHMAYATPLLWRIDFNGRISEAEFLKWWGSLDDSVKARIDYVEDPIASGELKIDGPWANDWKMQARARVRIIKPARQKDEDYGQYARVIFTHSLDHPFGQACSAWVASRYYMRHPKRMEVCGLAATDFFTANDFSRKWNCEGPRMKPTEGTGFGFDELLNAQPWERVL